MMVWKYAAVVLGCCAHEDVDEVVVGIEPRRCRDWESPLFVEVWLCHLEKSSDQGHRSELFGHRMVVSMWVYSLQDHYECYLEHLALPKADA